MRRQNTDQFIGAQIADYKIEKLLGQGGMARVYHGFDVNLHRHVALKVIDYKGYSEVNYEERFKLEARAIAQLQHPNIVGIYRFGDEDGIYYMAMHYIDGADLRWMIKDYLASNELIPHKTILKIMTQVAKALDYAHQRGVIHRDIKPSNIMLNDEGNAIITDFGLALMQSEGTQGDIFGSPHYIAPEQAINSAGVVPQSDIYSLGVMLYQMLTGSVPFDDDTPMQIAMAHMTKQIPDLQDVNPNLHQAFNPIIKKALAKDPKDRYETASKLIIDLRDAIRQEELDAGSRKAVTKPRQAPKSSSKTNQNLQISLVDVTAKLEKYHKENPLPAVEKPHDDDQTNVIKKRNIKKGKKSRSLSRVFLMILLIALIGGGAFVATQTDILSNLSSGAGSSPATLSIAGQVTAINGEQINIYDMELNIDDSTLLNALEIGDFVQLTGNHSEVNGIIQVQSIHQAIVNDELVIAP